MATDAIPQPNGGIVVAGQYGVARFLSNGSLDTSFGAHGVASTTVNDAGLGPSGAAIQPDGKIIWVGDNSTGAVGVALADYVG